MPRYRIEHDTMGEVRVPAAALWRAQTQRAVENFPISGTTLEPTLRTVDIISQVQAQRGILELSFAEHEAGLYMFHAHVTEFTELGWMAAFDVRDSVV